MVLVSVTAAIQVGRIGVSAQIASIRKATCRVPVAAAVERARITSKPMVADPPAVGVIGIGAMAVPIIIALVRIRRVAMRKVAIVEVWIHPTRLPNDAAEPAVAIAIDWTIEMRRFYALLLARGP